MTGIHKILISRLRFMGDVILTTPLVRQLREAYPKASLAYLTDKNFAPLLENHPCLDEVIPFSAEMSFTAQIQFYRKLHQRRFDLAIDLFGNPRTALMSWFSGAKYRVGGDYRGRRLLYNMRISQPEHNPDAISYHLRSLAPLGITARHNLMPEIFVTDEERDRAKRFIEERHLSTENPLVGMHPGATWPNKQWPISHFIQAIKKLNARHVQVLVTQGPQENHIVEQLKSAASNVTVLPVLPIRKIAAILSMLHVYVANDCGVMHLAVAVDTPTIGLFGPSQPEIWFPYDSEKGHQALSYPIDCSPCHKDYCPLEHLNCQTKLNPDDVVAAVLKRLT